MSVTAKNVLVACCVSLPTTDGETKVPVSNDEASVHNCMGKNGELVMATTNCSSCNLYCAITLVSSERVSDATSGYERETYNGMAMSDSHLSGLLTTHYYVE